MSILPSATRPAQEAVCGILVANIPGVSGAQVSTIALFLSLLGMAIGMGLWQQTITRGDQNLGRAMQILGILVLLSMFAGAMGWWLVGMALAMLTALLLIISLRFVAA